jgi:hypothetical protein
MNNERERAKMSIETALKALGYTPDANGVYSCNPFVSSDDTAHAVVLGGRVVREKGHSIAWEAK